MAEKRYYWLKLFDDFFTSKRIKKLRNLAGGDTYTIIYLKMQLKALKDEGYLYFDGVMSDFAEELALDLDESPEDVALTIQYLLSVGLLETNNDEVYKLTYMDRLIGSETASTQRVRDYRERQKQQKTLQCNATVTEMKQVGNAEIEKEKEKEIDIENNSIDILSSKSQKNEPLYDEIINYLNEKTGQHYKSSTEATCKSINGRLKEGYTVDDFKKVIDIKTSQWLKDKEMSMYLRPSTLFSPSKFESYLNEATKNQPASKYDDLSERIRRSNDEQFNGNTDTAGFR